MQYENELIMKTNVCVICAAAILCCSCDEFERIVIPEEEAVSLPEIARMLSSLPLEEEHLQEVFEAVSGSAGNGYDEEYTMKDLFLNPGSGVGSSVEETRASSERYDRPLRVLIEEFYEEKYRTKAGETDFGVVKDCVDALVSSDAQIYWPYSSAWDGKQMPVITFNLGIDTDSNVGYEIVDSDGRRTVREITVTEKMASERPVWVVNTNDDSSYQSIEMLRKLDPDWGTGGEVIVKSGVPEVSAAVAGEQDFKTLVLEDFTMKRNYDCWFAGASEFFVKCGALEHFTASTEAEMRLYDPHITDFMVVVKRSQVGVKQPFSAILITDWSEQMDSFAFMITEDDGGTRTTWKSSAIVKVNSKAYGFEIELPFNSRDDIVWRGQLSNRFFKTNGKVTGNFGDVTLTFSFL